MDLCALPFVVFARHNFHAEEDDEIAFAIGEPVVVLQRDEPYGDGWWRGKNVRGDEGLFPRSFVTLDNIAGFDVRSVPAVAAVYDQATSTSPTLSDAPSDALSDDRQASLGDAAADRHALEHSANGQQQPGARAAEPLSPSHPAAWSAAQVAAWIADMGMHDSARLLQDHGISGTELVAMTLGRLRELGVEPLADRVVLMHRIISLKEPLAAVTPISPAAVQPTAVVVHSNILDASAASDNDQDDATSHVQQDLSRFTVSDYLLDAQALSIPEDATLPTLPADPELPASLKTPGQPDTSAPAPPKTSKFGSVFARSKTAQPPADGDKRPAKLGFSFGSLTRKLTLTSRNKAQDDLDASPSSSHPPAPPGSQRPPLRSPSPVISMSNSDYSGWLYVRFAQDRLWKRRFCVLENGQVHLFKAKHDDLDQKQQLVGSIPLNADMQVLPDPPEGAKTPFAFKLEPKHSGYATAPQGVAPSDRSDDGINGSTSSATGSHRGSVSSGRSSHAATIPGVTFHFAADTQIAMVGWINVMVRAATNALRSTPMPLLPIKDARRRSGINDVSAADLGAHALRHVTLQPEVDHRTSNIFSQGSMNAYRGVQGSGTAASSLGPIQPPVDAANTVEQPFIAPEPASTPRAPSPLAMPPSREPAQASPSGPTSGMAHGMAGYVPSLSRPTTSGSASSLSGMGSLPRPATPSAGMRAGSMMPPAKFLPGGRMSGSLALKTQQHNASGVAPSSAPLVFSPHQPHTPPGSAPALYGPASAQSASPATASSAGYASRLGPLPYHAVDRNDATR
ncbi:hypothetical protein BC831DRAFT_447745 [Entophlyctis helioformis]|nr:hypothetical protein BC831DRAFT_447745 [Entophlyctis helioformis]